MESAREGNGTGCTKFPVRMDDQRSARHLDFSMAMSNATKDAFTVLLIC